MGRFSFKRKSNVNIGRVVSKIAITLISLWAGGTIVNTLGDTMIHTASPFYSGLSLIGWRVNNTNGIYETSSTGILGVIGLIAIASIIMEFVQIRMG